MIPRVQIILVEDIVSPRIGVKDPVPDYPYKYCFLSTKSEWREIFLSEFVNKEDINLMKTTNDNLEDVDVEDDFFYSDEE